MGEWWYLQEYECTFQDAEDSVFRLEDIERALERGEEENVAPLFPEEVA
jgi:hypothetical protein